MGTWIIVLNAIDDSMIASDEHFDHFVYTARHCGREQERLSLMIRASLGQLMKDRLNVLSKSHVEQTIHFVQNQHLDVFETVAKGLAVYSGRFQVIQ